MDKRLSQSDLACALGHDVIERRLTVLRLVAQSGSISQAARVAAISYKAAWQAIDILSKLAGTPLVQATVGGRNGGGALLTPAGRQLLETHERLQALRSSVLSESELATKTQGDSAQVHLGPVHWQHSMRNQLLCQVGKIRPGGSLIEVELLLSQQQVLRSSITEDSFRRLALEQGMPIWALCKATAVRVTGHEDSQEPSNMQNETRLIAVQGEVSDLTGAHSNGQVTVALGQGQQLVGFHRQSGLAMGQRVQAEVAPEAIVLAKAA